MKEFRLRAGETWEVMPPEIIVGETDCNKL